jgi:aspartyl-tRNA(Asn)/glutamyl-tRNA(Gln) amidotransferase subunit B
MVSQVLTRDQKAGKRVANWVASNLNIEEDIQVESLARIGDLIVLAEMTEKNEISSNAASELFNDLMSGATEPRKIADEKNLLQVSDESEIARIVDEVLADPASQKAVEDIKSGNDKAIGFLVGQIMKKSAGKANPALAQKLIRERL